MRADLLSEDHLGHATLVSLLAYVGLRPREALGLAWEHLDRSRLLLPADLTKGRIARTADIPRPVVADLGRWKLASGAVGGLVFPRPSDGERWTKSDWDNWRNRGFTRAAGKAGLLEWDEGAEPWLGDFRPYDLRHTCASLMIRAHVPPADVAAQLGTSLELLFRTYAHSIEAMRGRPSTPVTDAIHAARSSLKRSIDCSENVRRTFGGAGPQR
jgi:integrase